MKRRTFLTIAGIGSAVAAFASFKFFTTPFDKSAQAIIEEELPFLKLDPEGIAAFLKDYDKGRDRLYQWTIKGYGLLGITSAQSGKIHQLVSNYLLSTDFFQNKMDESRVIRYVALYDPYLRPCAHPFSHLQYPEETGHQSVS
jgi:hypothetical protein